MATTRRAIIVRAFSENSTSTRVEVVYLVPVPPISAVPTTNKPRALFLDSDIPNKGGYTAAEVADFQAGLWKEVRLLGDTNIPMTGNAATDKAAIKNYVQGKWVELRDAEAGTVPFGRYAGMNWDPAGTPSWIDLWG